MATFKVMCPKCGGKQLVQPRGLPAHKTKRCVYCGKSFVIHSGGRDSRILKQVR